MIPAGRHAIDTAGVAQIRGVTLGALNNAKPYNEPDFPPQLNPHTRTGRLWDEQQVRAHAAGKPIPPLPTEPHPNDFLDDREAAEYVGMALSSWMSAVQKQAPAVRGEKPRDFYGVRHWRRATLDRIRDRRRPAGRPAGATDRAPRKRRGQDPTPSV